MPEFITPGVGPAPAITPLLESAPIVPEFHTPAPGAPGAQPMPPLPPAIVPLLVNVVIVPALDTPVPPGPAGPVSGKMDVGKRTVPFPPLPPAIVPTLVNVVIVPAFDTPVPPWPPTGSLHPLPPIPPATAPVLVRLVIVPLFHTPAPPGARVEAPPPPVIVAPLWLSRAPIVWPAFASTPATPEKVGYSGVTRGSENPSGR